MSFYNVYFLVNICSTPKHSRYDSLATRTIQVNLLLVTLNIFFYYPMQRLVRL